eukprot:TRINITY_DN444_c0_g1_i1.p1 TRINITY_DN444_c0_g1~~TRINITY_DN444_c0_g1_i1.p1  ORF type:complete len:556 (-),score=112.56 TRINITY_DN444_c0_g1_i1:41-1678(-)
MLPLFVFVAAASAGTAQPFSSSEQTEFLTAHNTVRAAVSPPAATPIPNLVWDAAVAARAQSWSDNCTFAHNTFGDGQNLYVTTASTASPTSTSNSWSSEVSNWRYAIVGSDSANGGVVGHYTQMIWAATTKIGCGRTYCNGDLSGWSGHTVGTVVACNYQTPGNYLNQYPYVAQTVTPTRTRTATAAAPLYVCGQAIPAGVTSARLAVVASGNYIKNANCVWLFNNTQPGCGLTFTLKSINSEADGDFLTVNNGPTNSVVRLLHWSGTSLPSVTTVQSTGSTLTVTFVGDNDLLVGTGFTATVTPYCSVPAVRTTYYMGDTVPNTAFNAPFTLRNVAAGVVPKSTTTTWSLAHPSTLCSPRITFSSFSSETEGDILTVLSGTTGTMVRWSGNSSPPALTSRTNVMTVRFVTNAAVMSAGFVATVDSVCTPQTFYVGDVIPANTYNSVLKVVETGNYLNNLNATWTYTRTTPGCFSLTFTALNTEAGTDLVRVVDNATATTLVTASGATAPSGVFKSTGTSLKVWFTSNAAVAGSGFTATVLAVAC